MKILLVTGMFPPNRTGTSFYARNLANSLGRNGHRVKVVTFSGENVEDPGGRYSLENIRALKIPLENYFKHLRFCSLFPANYQKINTISKSFKADVILLVNHYLDIAFPAIAASKINNIPLVCSVGTQLQSCNPFKNKILNFLDRLICGNFVFPFCNRVVAWDNEILRYLQDIQGDKVTQKTAIVNYGVNGDIEAMMAKPHDYSLHNQIIGVGAVSEQRSFVPLVEAFALIAKEFPKVTLKIIGQVYYDAVVERSLTLGISDRVIFTGELDHESVLSEFKNSDAYFVSLTGNYAGLGTATIESMLMGVPAIAKVPTNLLGDKTTLHDMEDILLCDDLSPVKIANQIRTLLDSENTRKKIGTNGRDFIVKNLNWEKVTHDMVTLLKDVVVEHSRR